MPINVLLAARDTVEITYANQTSLNTLKTIEHLLPITASEAVGSCIDIFHKDPQRIRKILADPANLPHKAVIVLGDQKLRLDVSALMDKAGEYLGPMVAWSVVTEEVKMADSVSEVVGLVSSASTELNANAASLTQNADITRDRASTVASAATQLGSSINEISRQVSHTTEVAREAAEAAKSSSEMIDGLAATAEKIGTVVAIIQDIAEQTNLLALNATIEAARAGEAGKGFAVVASEVKALANQTAKATEDNSEQIDMIQSATGSAVEANEAITKKIGEINSVTASIASAIEEQNAATQEVNQNITMVSDASVETEGMAKDVMQASSELSRQAELLQTHIMNFLQAIGVDK
jgi:methyl-accepting chemotaxis protein